jgi:hypothetical protein
MSTRNRTLLCGLFGAVLSLAAIDSAEAAQCVWVKDNPQCWGDVCPTHQQCTPTAGGQKPTAFLSYCDRHPWVWNCRHRH